APTGPSPAYGYPQQGGYQTPSPAGYSPQPGPSTPPPYNLTPQTAVTPSGGGRNNKPVIIGSVIVSVVAVGGLVTALLLNGGSEDDKGGGGSSASASASAEKKPGYRGPDTAKTIDTEECTEPRESYNDPDKIQIPDFKFKNIKSVKACLQAAGWEVDEKKVDENTYGDGTVMNQFPSADTDVDPKDMPEIELSVSTGNPPS
ncbi:PASTA domain-containing protein, partial [Streptomyces cahuitamycinicus]